MKANNLRDILSDCCNDVTFQYNGMDSGITVEVHDYIPVFQAWNGEKTKEYDNVDDVMNDKFYSGKSLVDLSEIVQFSVI